MQIIELGAAAPGWISRLQKFLTAPGGPGARFSNYVKGEDDDELDERDDTLLAGVGRPGGHGDDFKGGWNSTGRVSIRLQIYLAGPE